MERLLYQICFTVPYYNVQNEQRQRKTKDLYNQILLKEVLQIKRSIHPLKQLGQHICLELKLAKLLRFIDERDGTYRLTLKGEFYYHYYENF